jgi:MGT family glycosyltransferase
VRVLVSVVPGLGHLHPMVPLCRALVDAGHEVRVAVPRRFAPVVERAGLRADVVRPDWLEEEAEAFHPAFARGVSEQMRAFARAPREGLVEDLVGLGGAWGTDVVLHDHTEFGGWVAAELLGVPNVPYAMTARVLDPAMLGRIAAEPVHELLAHAGLPPDPDLVRPSRWLYLDSIPPSFAGAVFPPGPSVRPVRYCTEDRSGDEVLPTWVDDLGGRPLVYVTLGTVFNRTPGLLRTLVAGAASLDVDVVVTTGRTVDPASLGPLPCNVRAERYVPQVELLPRCDVVVCHGGFNTVFGALGLGRPVVLVPLSADQPFNAYLCQANGLGVSCTSGVPEGELLPAASPDAVTPEQVAAAVGEVLRAPSYRAAAGRVRDEIQAQPPVEHGVRLLEELVAGV